MKHASPAALESLTPLLEQLRAVEFLVEKRPGVFYRKSRAFLHFHEDPEGFFADLRVSGDDFVRYPVTTTSQQRTLLKLIRNAAAQSS